MSDPWNMNIWGRAPAPSSYGLTAPDYSYGVESPASLLPPVLGQFGLNTLSTAPSYSAPTLNFTAAAPQGSFLDSLASFSNSFFGTRDTPGWSGQTLGAVQGLGNLWMGMKQYGLAKEKLAESKRQFELNYDAQRKLTNSQLEDRQRARVASNPGAYQSVGDYMSKYRIGG